MSKELSEAESILEETELLVSAHTECLPMSERFTKAITELSAADPGAFREIAEMTLRDSFRSDEHLIGRLESAFRKLCVDERVEAKTGEIER